MYTLNNQKIFILASFYYQLLGVCFKLKGKKGFSNIIALVIGVILIISVLLPVVLTQVSTVNTTALGTTGTTILGLLGVGVVIMALVLIFGAAATMFKS